MKKRIFMLLSLLTCMSALLRGAQEQETREVPAVDEFPDEGEVYGDVVVNENWGETRFMWDIAHGVRHQWAEDRLLAVVQEHIDEGVSVNKVDYKGRTALMLACKLGVPYLVIQKLIEEGASLTQRCDRRLTALDYAWGNRYTEKKVKDFLCAHFAVEQELILESRCRTQQAREPYYSSDEEKEYEPVDRAPVLRQINREE
jgi:Ankyrin repeats (many copies)